MGFNIHASLWLTGYKKCICSFCFLTRQKFYRILHTSLYGIVCFLAVRTLDFRLPNRRLLQTVRETKIFIFHLSFGKFFTFRIFFVLWNIQRGVLAGSLQRCRCMSSVARQKAFLLGQVKVRYGIINAFYWPLIKLLLLLKSFTN